MTLRTDASSFWAKAGSPPARSLRAAVIAGTVDAVAVRTMSPPAAMNRTARAPGATASTALATPTSSVMTTPW